MDQPIKHNGAFVITAIVMTMLSFAFAAKYYINSNVRVCEFVLEQRINPNIATVQALVMLEGIGPVKAQRIVDYRQSNGFFNDANDLGSIPGIGPKTIQKIKNNLKFE